MSFPNPLRRYANWLHLQWPAGEVETLPVADRDGSTSVPGLFIVGDLTGIPLLKLSNNAGVAVVRKIAKEGTEARKDAGTKGQDVLDVAIIGGGTSGFAAAKEAKKLGLRAMVFEASEPFSTIVNFPKAKPIYTYPTDTPLEGDIEFHEKSDVKEGLLEDLREQTVDQHVPWVHGRVTHIERVGGRLEVVLAEKASVPEGVNLNGESFVTQGERIKARHVIVGIGRSGNYRKLNVPGEEKDKVYNRLHDPADYAGQNVLVVGGGDSAIETAAALAEHGATVTLSYRRKEFSRPKPDNQEKIDSLTGDGPGRIKLLMPSNVTAIRDDEVAVKLDENDEVRTLPNTSVFTMIGREPPLDFFRRSGVKIRNEKTWAFWLTLAAFVLLCVWMYHWKKGGVVITGIPRVDHLLDIGQAWNALGWFPYGFAQWLQDRWHDQSSALGTLAVSLGEPGFYYSFLYCACVVGFGIDRVKRKPTPYIKKQVTVLSLFQLVPLFLLPYLVLPWLGHNGLFDGGAGKTLADAFFPEANYGHGREYWRAFGFILAWPLFIWNVFTDQPMWAWLAVSFVQTFVLIPAIIYYWGKGAYCGWICSCGALAETLGDRHREKMPHGMFWNRVNFVGQAFLVFAFVLLGLRAAGWIWPGSFPGRWFAYLLHDMPLLNYVWFVDLLWAGILGVGMYFWFSGRVWCRFGCPLAALMHIYHRFSSFAILADKKKCISCNECTTVCHQGIDVMAFANKGKPMIDPQCVRCSACVQSCPTGVLSFGRINGKGEAIAHDPSWLAASPVLMKEVQLKHKGKVVG